MRINFMEDGHARRIAECRAIITRQNLPRRMSRNGRLPHFRDHQRRSAGRGHKRGMVPIVARPR